MVDKQVMQERVYTPMTELKNKFFQTKNQEEWDNCKVELKELLELAKELMDSEFYEKYKKGVVDSIAKMFTFKEKYFSKFKGEKKMFTPAPKYIFQDDLATALADYIKLKTKMLELEYKKMCKNIED